MSFVVIGVMGRTIIISKVNVPVLKLLWRMFIPLWTGGNEAVPIVVLPVSVEFKFCLCVLEGLPVWNINQVPKQGHLAGLWMNSVPHGAEEFKVFGSLWGTVAVAIQWARGGHAVFFLSSLLLL